MRIFRWLAVAVLASIALMLIAAAVLLLVVDPDRFRGRIEAAVREASGRDFRLEERIELEFFPSLAIDTGFGRLSNAPGFVGPPGAAPFASWRKASLGARLVPLLRGELIVDRVRIEGLELNLARDAHGAGNWEDLAAGGGEGEGRDGGDRRLALESLAGIEVSDSTLSFRDARSGRELRAGGLSLEVDAWRPGKPVELESAFDFSTAPMRVPVRTRVAAHVIPTSEGASVELAELVMEVANARAEGRANVRVGGASTAGVPSGEGALKLEAGSMRMLLVALGVEPRPTRDPKALGRTSIDVRWRLSPAERALFVDPLTIALDETTLAGKLEWPLAEEGVIRFALLGDAIDLARYLEPEGFEGEPFVLPTEALARLRASGEVTFAAASLADARLKGVRLRLVLDEGGLRAMPPERTPAQSLPRPRAGAQP